jgi:hypothetical protein
MAARIRRRQQ